MLDLQETLEESQSMSGALGAIAFVAVKALSSGGAPDEVCKRAENEFLKYFANLSDADCNTLSEVAHRRLKDRPESGDWY